MLPTFVDEAVRGVESSVCAAGGREGGRGGGRGVRCKWAGGEVGSHVQLDYKAAMHRPMTERQAGVV